TDPDIEHYATAYTYSEDGKYLLQEREDNGLVKRYCYCDGRLSAVLTGNEEQILRRNFYHYDASGTIVAEIEDDGSSCTESDLSQVTERRFTRLLPEQEGAAKGK